VHDAEHPFRTLGTQRDVDELAREQGLPSAHLRGVQTFYDALQVRGHAPCVGTACWLSHGATDASHYGVHCRGQCYAPLAEHPGPIPRRVFETEPVVLRHLLGPSTESALADYALPDAETIMAAVERSELRGRGGAAYPTGKKWLAAKHTQAAERVVVANGDEGDPGAYVDRLIMEEAPHSLLAGMLACGRAIGARTGIVFVRAEYPRAKQTLEAAIAEARERGVLGSEFDVRVVQGAGSYVAGEETALLRAIEGLRAEPQPKPPYPAERGLWGLPTVVQNIETLSIVPWVVQHTRRPPNKALCLSGAVARPGVIEVELGTSLRRVLELAAGVSTQALPWKMALVGGPMGRVIAAQDFEVVLDYDTLPGLGHGGIVVMDESVSARRLFEHLVAFAVQESCGNCTPCRAGSAQLARRQSPSELERLLRTMELGSLCGFGQGVPRPIRDLIRCFPGEIFA